MDVSSKEKTFYGDIHTHTHTERTKWGLSAGLAESLWQKVTLRRPAGREQSFTLVWLCGNVLQVTESVSMRVCLIICNRTSGDLAILISPSLFYEQKVKMFSLMSFTFWTSLHFCETLVALCQDVNTRLRRKKIKPFLLSVHLEVISRFCSAAALVRPHVWVWQILHSITIFPFVWKVYS